jgi:hypothetical protein
MLRAFAIGGVVAATLASGSADLSACGDKFLRAGRSARFRGYAAVHPSSILIYSPANSKPEGIKQFQAILRRAGHKPFAVENGARLSEAFAAASYDVVIADYHDVGMIKEQLRAVPSEAAILPILYKPSKALSAEAEKEYQCIIKPHAMNKYEAVAEIDRLIELRLKAAAPASR